MTPSRQARRIRLALAAAMVAMLAAGCDDPTPPPAPVPGIYALEAIDGQPLPQVVLASEQQELVVRSAQLRLPDAYADPEVGELTVLTLDVVTGAPGGPHAATDPVQWRYVAARDRGTLRLELLSHLSMSYPTDTLVADGTRLRGRMSLPGWAVSRPVLTFQRLGED